VSDPRPPLRVEITAGITTFFTMAYIVVVNPSILATEGTGMPLSGVAAATVLVCFVCTLLMGLYARLPFAVAPGMGINAFFAYSLVLGRGIAWPVALGLVFWAGVIFLLVSVTPLREAIARAIPASLRTGAAVGIGLFLTLIGLKNAGVVVDHPATLVTLGPIGHEVGIFAIGTVIAAALMHRKSPLAFLAAIAVCTGLGAIAGDVHLPERALAMPDFGSVLLRLDPLGALSLALVPAMLSIMLTDLFDSISTFVGVADAAGLADENGDPPRLREGLIVDAIATLGAGLAGTSSGTAYIESAAGIEAGGRTGRTAIVTALCFLPCFFLAPVVGMVPAYATAPVLVLVGASMFRSIARVDLRRIEELVPVFLTAVMIPLTFSITQGILWGFLSHAVLHAVVGRAKEVRPGMWGLAALAAAMLWLER
jgi:AGZA family xanthine/uracil permease-like MFS transporter